MPITNGLLNINIIKGICLPDISYGVVVVQVNCVEPEGVEPGLIHAFHVGVVICNTELTKNSVNHKV